MTAAKPISVLFLTRYPQAGASSRYRVFQYISRLEELGITCTVQSFMDADMYRASLSSGGTARKLLLTGRAFLNRLRALLRYREYDVIYMQREMLPFGPPIVERFLKNRGVALAFDYDDALFIKQTSRYNPLATLLRSPEKTLDLFKLVDMTVAGNDWLRDSAIKAGGSAVTLEVAEDPSRYISPDEKFAEPREPVTIGWLGSPSTAKYLNEIAPVLQAIARRHPDVRWELMGSGEFSMEGIPWETHEWSLAAEAEALARFDIGLMPLPDQDWSRGKSGGKARTYMAASAVPVVSAIGYNCELIRDAETGFLCEEQDQWGAVLESLIGDPAMREKVARAARRDVELRFDPNAQAEKLAAILRDLADNRSQRA